MLDVFMFLVFALSLKAEEAGGGKGGGEERRIWRFRLIIYIIYLTPSFGDSGSSYVLITPAHFAIPAHHIS